MVDKFEAVIDNFVRESKEKMLLVVKESIQDVIEEAETPIQKGGKMPVDTGFLRNSGQGALNTMPVGEIRGRRRLAGETGVLPEYVKNSDFLSPVIGKMKIGDIFNYGWTAIYAQTREIYNGFLGSTIMNWQQIVNNNIRKLKK